MTLAHWDDAEGRRSEVGDMRATFRRLGAAAGASVVGVARIDIDPGCRAGPVHVHGFGENHDPILTRVPRAGVGRRAGLVIELSGDDPLRREAAAGPLDLPEPTPRPPCIVAFDEVEEESEAVNDVAVTERDVA